jgi:predicted amidohydrolase
MAVRLRVSGMQMSVTEDVGRQVETICHAVELAASADADILLTPEGSLSGYTPVFNTRAVEDGLQRVTGLAREKGIALALGTCFLEPDEMVYNQLRFYDRAGNYLGFHGKILRCGTLTEPPVGEINHYAGAPLRTFLLDGITVGGLICNDLWANPACTPVPDPHLTHLLANLGARVIFHAVNGGRNGSPWSREVVWSFHESNLRMRAEADHLWVVTVDNCYPPNLPCSAPGGVIDPQGRWASRTPAQGGYFFTHTIELDG